MKKITPILVLALMIGLTFFGWFKVFKNKEQKIADYEEYICKAEDFESKGIYFDALENYRAALEISGDDYAIASKVADMYYELSNYQEFLNACDAAIAIDDDAPEAYIRKAEYYFTTAQYKQALEVVNAAASRKIESKELSELGQELKTKCYQIYLTITAVSDWHCNDNTSLMAAEENGKWGLIDAEGKRKVRFSYSHIGSFDSEANVIPCERDGEWYYIDINGNKRLAGNREYTYLGSFGNGLAPAQAGEKYGYIDREFNEYKFEFDYAGAFANGTAAVEKNGKWALINEKLDPITDFVYDTVLLDDYGFCSSFGAAVVKTGDTYSLINVEGKELFGGFEAIEIPASETEPVAVMKNGKWGFVDRDGKMVISANYDQARSFSLGMAPVMIDGKWGYIDQNNKVVIEPQYTDATAFSPDGSAVVKGTNNWNMLILCAYYND